MNDDTLYQSYRDTLQTIKTDSHSISDDEYERIIARHQVENLLEQSEYPRQRKRRPDSLRGSGRLFCLPETREVPDA